MDDYSWVDDLGVVDMDELSSLYRVAPLGNKPPRALATVFGNSMFGSAPAPARPRDARSVFDAGGLIALDRDARSVVVLLAQAAKPALPSAASPSAPKQKW